MSLYQVDINKVVRNYDLSNSNGFLFCLFEAVSNALYCSENNKDIKITVRFTREYKANEITKDDDNYITSFSVTDNGTGFTEENYKNFTKKLYETNHECGKGLGRIAYLKVFKNVSIKSLYLENDKYFSRNFKFDTGKIIDNKNELENRIKPETTIFLNNIKDDYRDDTKKSTEYYS